MAESTADRGAAGRSSFLDLPLEETLGVAELLAAAEIPTDDVGLRFYFEVLGLRHLHYGLWDESDPLTLAGLERAQERYLEGLLALIPDRVTSILDAGCGAGGNALALKERGYAVEGLSPDPAQGERFRAATGCRFHLAKLQDFRPERRYDLVLMSESAQYVPLDRLFPAVRLALEPGGCLILSDYFVLEKDGSYVTKSGHRLSDFAQAREDSGFVVEHQEDITDRVAPTLDLGCALLEQQLVPAVRLGLLRAAQKRPRWTRAVLRFLRKRLRKLDQRKQNVDSRLFRDKKRYLVYRLRAPS